MEPQRNALARSLAFPFLGEKLKDALSILSSGKEPLPASTSESTSKIPRSLIVFQKDSDSLL